MQVLTQPTCKRLEDQASLLGTLQNEAAEPQVMGAILSQLAKQTRHTLR